MGRRFDAIIRAGLVVDGSGSPGYVADLGIAADRVAAIGAIDAASAPLELDASGHVVAPGFIDVHTHDDRLLLSAPEMTPKVSQGVTTVVAGNCGISLAPMPGQIPSPPTPPLDLLDTAGDWFRFRSFGAYVEALQTQPAAVNAALLVGHTTLRVSSMPDLNRPARRAEVQAMRAMVREALQAGAIGVSTGLYYEPAAAAPTEEVIEVCQPLVELGGVYCTHMRNEAEAIMSALEESCSIGQSLRVPVVISHHKLHGAPNHGRSAETLAFITSRRREQSVGLDCYPYIASSTILSADRARAASRVLVTWSQAMPQYTGRDLAEIASELGLSQDEAVARLLPAGAVYFSMHEDDVRRILTYPPTMIGSDGLPHDSFPHPRLWATFPRVLGHYARDLGLLSLEAAVHKMTGLSARTFGLRDRGELREGAFADITVFDPKQIAEGADFTQPIAPAHGIDAVFVNGQLVWRDGRSTGARPGQVLRRG